MGFGLQQMVDLLRIGRNNRAHSLSVPLEFVYLGPIRTLLHFHLLGVSVAPHEISDVKHPFFLGLLHRLEPHATRLTGVQVATA